MHPLWPLILHLLFGAGLVYWVGVSHASPASIAVLSVYVGYMAFVAGDYWTRIW